MHAKIIKAFLTIISITTSTYPNAPPANPSVENDSGTLNKLKNTACTPNHIVIIVDITINIIYSL